ncbi:MAG: glycosyltransferase family 2 protein [Patescibacteria group bacterium]|nr:glycosyltransferase family 2 protein [Patescibacteria group bacterium]
MDKLSIVILSYNTKKLTLDCIKSVFAQYNKNIENGEFEIIVADNASTDGTVSAIQNYSSRIKIIQNKENYGFGKGNNIAAEKASGGYLLFINSDTIVKDKGFIKMVEFLNNNKKVAVIGGRLIDKDGSDRAPAGKFYNLIYVFFTLFFSRFTPNLRFSPKKISDVDWVSGAFMMIRREVFRKLEGFDRNIFMYVEDMELCFRVKKLGYNIVFFPQSSLYHAEYGSSNRTFAIINIYKGILYFYKKHKSWQYLIVKMLLVVKALVAICIGVLTNNRYLKDTYRQGLRLAI